MPSPTRLYPETHLDPTLVALTTAEVLTPGLEWILSWNQQTYLLILLNFYTYSSSVILFNEMLKNKKSLSNPISGTLIV
ncbi:MAG: hypothetical protein KDI49_16300 [Gammaproteobacteria bacterium]|nr:hypothetical protein [Gammaproteobacteria bacterium]